MYSDRISTTAKYNLLITDIQRNQANFDKLTAQLASGHKITSITDDPIAAVNIVNTNRQLGQIETFNQNVAMGMQELATLDDLMKLASGYLSSAWDKAVQANNQTYGEGSLKALKAEIDEDIKTMVDLANTEYNDNYIFGGANTKLIPYNIDENGNIIYNGTPYNDENYVRKTEVADGVFETINTTGDKVFGYYKRITDTDGNKMFTDKDGNNVIENTVTNPDGTESKVYIYTDGTEYDGKYSDLTPQEEYSGVMGALKILSNSIGEVLEGMGTENEDIIQAGYAKMYSTLDMFDNSLTQITTEQTKFGGVYNRLEMTNSTLETNNENLTAYLQNVQEVDIAEAVSKWYQAQYAYQASLQVASASMGMSLLNYM